MPPDVPDSIIAGGEPYDLGPHAKEAISAGWLTADDVVGIPEDNEPFTQPNGRTAYVDRRLGNSTETSAFLVVDGRTVVTIILDATDDYIRRQGGR